MPPKTFKRRGGGGGNSMGAAMKAAFQQRDSTQIVINSTESVTLAVPADTNGSSVVRNVTKLLCSTEFFQHYAAMYDQFKIDGVSVSAEIVYNTFGQAALTYPNVISAWDRNGIDKASVTVRRDGVDYDAPVVPGPYQVASYSSAVSRAFYPGARWGITRRLVASSLQEKSIYLPTVKTAEVMTESSLYAAWNPDFLLSCLLGGKTPTCQSLVFNLSWSWVLTLRGLRKTSLDVIPTPLNGTIGYAPNNMGTVASGSDNAMIPAVRVTGTDQNTNLPITAATYYPNMQTYSGTQNTSSAWINDGFKLSINNMKMKLNGMDFVFYNFNDMAVLPANNLSAISEGDNNHINMKLYLATSKSNIGSNLGYKVQYIVAMNVGQDSAPGQMDGQFVMSYVVGGGLLAPDVKFFESDEFVMLLPSAISAIAGMPTKCECVLTQTVGNTTSDVKFSMNLVSNAATIGGNSTLTYNGGDFNGAMNGAGSCGYSTHPSFFVSSIYDNDGTALLPVRTV